MFRDIFDPKFMVTHTSIYYPWEKQMAKWLPQGPSQAATHHLLPTAADAAGFPRPFLDFAAEVPRTHRGRRDDLCGLRALVPVAHHLAGIVESSWREMGTSNEPPQKPRQY